MTINDQIRDEKIQYDINREAAKISVLPGKTFEKQIKTIEDPGEKQIDTLQDLKPKEQTKPSEDKSNNKSEVAIIFDNLINKRKGLMKELYDSVDYDNLKFEYVGPTKDVSFYEYKDSKELFNAIKDNRINFDDVVKRQNELLNKISNLKIGKKTDNQKKVINNLENFLEKKSIIFLETTGKWFLMQPTNQNKMKLREKD